MPEEIRFSAEFDRFACRGSAAAWEQQDVIGGFFHARGPDWAFDPDAGTLSGNGRSVSQVTRLGTFDEGSESWLWTWDDPRFGWEDPATEALRAVYEVGEQLDIVELTTGGFSLAEFANPAEAALTLAIAAGRVLDGLGVWSLLDSGSRSGSDFGSGPGSPEEGTVFVHLGDESLPRVRFDPLAAPRLLWRAVALFPADPRAVVLGFAEHFRLKLDLDPDRIVLYGDGGSVAIDFDGGGRIVSCESDVSEAAARSAPGD